MQQSPLGTPNGDGAATDDGMTVVGIGASAGGLKALQQFVKAIPAESGMAYVIIVHLDPDRESRMGELLQDKTALPVSQVNGPTALEAERIYIIPPDRDLAVEGTMLTLRDRGERSEHTPVDLFFRTLAEANGANAVGVILSGTGSDGTAGIRHIREAGGITVAQQPDEAEYDGMPTSAISTGLIDLVLASAQIPVELQRLRQQSTSLASGEVPEPDLEAGLAPIFAALRSRTGHDFSLYKRSTVLRRLERRMRFNGVSTLQDYHPLLQANSTEGEALLRDLLISVSSFFRDAEAFEGLEQEIPALFKDKGPNDAVRVWVVGCATGEEVYSIAMVLSDYAAGLTDPPRLQLFATDIDEHGYNWARAGLYTASSVSSVPPDKLRRFFTKEPGGYRIVKSLRELVLFAGHNVLHDAPFSRMDLISCRNFFIYLQPEAQERVLETFHFSLHPDGLLFLGASESVGENGLFTAMGSTKRRIFRRNAVPYRVMPRISAADPAPGVGGPTVNDKGRKAENGKPRFSYGSLHLKLLEQYAPASAVVNERLDVVHLSESAGRFLRLGEGEPTQNLLGLAPESLRRVLRTALHQAFDNGTATTRNLRMKIDGTEHQVTVQVRPSQKGDDVATNFALIVFELGDAPVMEPARVRHSENGGQGIEVELEEELQRTRALLDATSAAHDRTVAELHTVNEELRSINEEQKAASEELETGREEIQSINEELTTINQEHQSTIEELKRTNGDLQNLIESTDIGTVFLDRKMCIRRFTPSMTAIFNFAPTDQGRPFRDITHGLDYPELLTDVEQVLASQERVEREANCHNGASYIVRINPYRSVDDSRDGVVLTFFDNTARHRVEEELRTAKVSAESANIAKGTFLSTLSHEFRTPLNAILGYADLVQLDGPLNPAQERKLDRIKTGGWHLVTMIDEILSFAKLDAGHEIVRSEPIDARSIAREAAELTEPSAIAKGLSFALETADIPLPIVTDIGKARQVLINLCGNAVKYTPSGQVRLRVRGDGRRAIFEISDTGIGISTEDQQRIFERFWQVDGGATRAAGGLGIGLAAAREYARLLRGDVELQSTPGHGSTFSLWLPLEYERRDDDEVSPA